MKNELLKRIISSIIFLPIVIFIIFKGLFYFNIFLTLCFSISTYEWYKMTKTKKKTYIGIIFLTLSFYTIYQIRNNFNDGYLYFLLILTICISADIGGFIFGKLLKGPKLTKISPNKTYAGVLGGFLLPILLIYLLSHNFYLKNFYNINFEIITFIIVVSAVSQFGDIIVSYFKRVSKIKDTGNIIPGHGGLLDRIDGMIFAFPFSYLIITTISIDFF